MKAAASKLFGMLLIVTLLISAVTAVYAVPGTIQPEGDPVVYRIESENMVNAYSCDEPVGELIIPGKVVYEGKEYTVTGIADKFMSKSPVLKSVTIPASVETIGKKAFSDCIKLTEVIFEEGSKLKTIREEAFAYLGKDDDIVPAAIEELVLPASLETLEESAFHCKPVKVFALESGSKLREIPDGFLAADGKDGMPGEDTECRTIWDKVIQWFKELTAPYPKTPEAVAKACDCLESIDLGDRNSLTRIGVGAFKNQTHLTGIDFGEDAESEGLLIDYGAFVAAGNNGYAADNGEEELGGIDTLVLPANLTGFGLKNYKGYKSRPFEAARIENLVFSDGCLLTEIPDGFMEIGGYGSQNGKPGTGPVQVGANSLKTVALGENNIINYIGAGAFNHQSHLSDIDFGTPGIDPATNKEAELSIGSGAFTGAGNNGWLVQNNIDDELCEGIETLTLPSNLVSIGGGAFELSRVKNLVFSDNHKVRNIPDNFMGQIDGTMCNGRPGTALYQVASNALETVKFGENNIIKYIGAGAFREQSHLTEIDFGTPGIDPETDKETELTIGSAAFMGAGNNGYFVERHIDDKLGSGIVTLTLPSHLVRIDGGAFELSRVKNLVFEDGCKVTSIPTGFMGHVGTGGVNGYPGTEGAQIGANALETIDFGKNNSLTTIRGGAFKNQCHITSIDFGTPAKGQDLSIEYGAFIGVGNNGYYVDRGIDTELSAGIETLTLPENLSSIGAGSFERARVKNLVFEDGCRVSIIPWNFFGHTGYGNNGYPGMSLTGDFGSFVKDMSQIGGNSLESVKFGDNNHISEIQSGSFMNQSHITEIDFGTAADGVELELESGTFSGVGNNSYLVENGVDKSLCEGIAALTLPANLKSVGSGIFFHAAFGELAFEDGCGLTSLALGAFQDIGVLEELTLGSDFPVTELNGGEFTRCLELTTLDMLGSKITAIGDAVKEDPKLTSIWFPETLVSITWPEKAVSDWSLAEGYSRDKICPFYGCGNVNELHFANTDPNGFSFDDDVLQFLNKAGIVYVPEETTDDAIEDYIVVLTDAGLTFAEDKWVIRRAVKVTGVELDKDSASLAKGKTLTLTATVQPEDATDKKVSWSSSNTAVATVDKNGKVTGVKAGTATITVTTRDGGFTDTCTVKVTDKKPVVESDDDYEPVPAPVTVGSVSGGEVSVSPKNADEGTTVTIKVTPDDGNEVDTVTVTTADGKEVEVKTKKEGDTYTFVMPDNAVFVDVSFKKTGEEAGLPFTDVSPSDYFYEAVKWAYFADPQVTDGTSPTTFSPFKTCNRAEVVTFLWRAVGKPEPAGAENPFTDVSESDWFYKPVLWAVEQGITEGTSPTTFSPKGSCRNDHILTFIYRAVGAGEDGWFMEAYNWAVEKGLIEGTYSGEFDLTAACPRANVVEYLYRYHKGL